MSAPVGEIDANFEIFFKNWTAQATRNWDTLHNNTKYRDSYRRLSALQGLKSDLVIPQISSESAAFFHEAHNDALSSHVNASVGAWRSSLQNLRSTLENTLSARYFKDHPVEYQLWSIGKLRPAFSELYSYMKDHPDLQELDPHVCGLDLFKSEYATLSKAVHGSATSFRMTDGASEILLWSTEDARAGAWADREKHVILAVSLLCIALFREQLSGTQKSGLRGALSLVIPKSRRQAIKQALKVTIPS